MASAREIKRRIKSVKNIMQITMALEAVSASKVRKATAQALASRAYANSALEVLSHVADANKAGPKLHPLLTKRDGTGLITIMLITGDRGLAGAYNSNVIRLARNFVKNTGKPVRWVAVGRKGRDTLIRMRENVIAEFTGLPSNWSIAAARPIARVLMDDYLNGNNDETYIAFTDFINSLTQQPRMQRLLPLMDVGAEATNGQKSGVSDYIYEPSPEAILDEIVPKFTETVVYQALLESTASEHSARMIAMRNASDNAKALADTYQLSYNKARQTAITSEILDIVGGVEALRGTRASSAASESPELVDPHYQAN